MLDDDLDSDFDDDDHPPAVAGGDSTGADTAMLAPLPPEPKFASVYRFVNDHLVDQYRRDVTGQRLIWCPRWWAHGEAVSRLEALWRAWEHLRLDGGTGMAVWWKDYADPTMAALFDPQGPFAGCSVDRGHKPRLNPLPVEPMPDEAVEWLMSDPSLRPELVPAP